MIKLLSKFRQASDYYVRGLYDRLSRHHAFLMSGGLAFSLFACAVPLAFVVLAILGNLFSKPELTAEIYGFVDRIVPYPDQAEPIKNVLADRIQQVSSVTEGAGLLGLLGLFVTATGLFSSLRTILNATFQTKEVESALIGKLWDFVLIIVVLVAMVGLMLALPAFEALVETVNEFGQGQAVFTGADKVLVGGFSLVWPVIVFSGIYWLVPVRRPNWRAVVVGALVSTVLWLMAKELFGLYIEHAATLRHIYGVYAFVVISAFWIYYSALVLIVGAEIGQLYSERYGEPQVLEDPNLT